jgi:hypothetical protein
MDGGLEGQGSGGKKKGNRQKTRKVAVFPPKVDPAKRRNKFQESIFNGVSGSRGGGRDFVGGKLQGQG